MPDYFESFVKKLSLEQQYALRQLRKDILYAAPEAEEGSSSGVPAFRYKGRYLASVNATKNHIALYIMQGDAINKHKHDLSDYETTNVAVRFSSSSPLTSELVKKLILTRIQEIDEY